MKLEDIRKLLAGNQELSAEQNMALNNCILFFRTGSQLYGTHTPESDDDYTGVFIPDPEYVFGKKYAPGKGTRLEQVEFNTNPSDSGKRNSKEDTDCMMFTLDKWTSMCIDNNPNRLELFFAPENCRLFLRNAGEKLLANYKLFLSLNTYGSFRGYSHEQMRRLKLKSGNNNGRKDLIEKYGYDTKMASHNIRLYLECIQILKQGKIDFPLKENQYLLDIKQGRVSFEDFLKRSEALEAMCDMVYASSTLPAEPDVESVSKLQESLLLDFWNLKKM